MQVFKGDDSELKMISAGSPAFDSTESALDAMSTGSANSSAFLLMLYDNGLVPYSTRIKRDAFVAFYREALNQFRVTGTFESYLFILRAIFGADAQIFFQINTFGGLEIDLNVANELTFDFIGYDDDGEYLISTQDGLNTLAFRGLSGFATSTDISLLISELMPAGIVPTLAINFYAFSNFIANDGGVFDVITFDGDQIVFYEIG